MASSLSSPPPHSRPRHPVAVATPGFSRDGTGQEGKIGDVRKAKSYLAGMTRSQCYCSLGVNVAGICLFGRPGRCSKRNIALLN